MKLKSYTIYIIAVIAVAVIVGLSSMKPRGISEPFPNFTVDNINCVFDGSEQGVLSFNFNLTVNKDETRIPGQIVFQILDVYKNYSFHKYKFFHGVNLTREYNLNKIYQAGETIENVSIVIDNVYRDYMYLPSEYFNYQLYYCEYTENQLNFLKENKKIFNVLDDECFLFFDFEHFYKDHMYSITMHKGVQCEYISGRTT